MERGPASTHSLGSQHCLQCSTPLCHTHCLQACIQCHTPQTDSWTGSTRLPYTVHLTPTDTMKHYSINRCTPVGTCIYTYMNVCLHTEIQHCLCWTAIFLRKACMCIIVIKGHEYPRRGFCCIHFSSFWHCHLYILQHFNGNVFTLIFCCILAWKYNAVYTCASPTPFVALAIYCTTQCNSSKTVIFQKNCLRGDSNLWHTALFSKKNASGGTRTRDILRTRQMLYHSFARAKSHIGNLIRMSKQENGIQN